MSKKLFTATVQIAFIIEEEQDPCDAVSEMLSGNLVHSGVLLDWQYQQINGAPIEPTEIPMIKNYKEGEAFIERHVRFFEDNNEQKK